ncbi:hypothetical protein B9Z19DRAFT_160815 [Tuber borchii]|uniref:Uncharacterized protein n=1 Tax=Tuber borchii TaxID=42251 RepID=A0A2T7A6J4_TUBBO|nr:hypothetical protein B9Z19DRAFT_160815 [Tuber borchii]
MGCREGVSGEVYGGKCASASFAFLAHAALLVGLIVAASYAGTSVLFAVFLAGAVSTWWDRERGGRWITAIRSVISYC